MMTTHMVEPPLALKVITTAEAVEAEIERYILEPAHCRCLAEPLTSTFRAALLQALRESGESNFTRMKSILSAMKLSKTKVYFPLGF